MKLSTICALLVAAVTLTGSNAFAERMTWTVAGEKRQALVYAPTAASPGGKVPLVLSFHGRGDDMENFQHTAPAARRPS